MNSNAFTVLVPWIIAHGYLIFLIAATIEGPVVTIAAGIAAASGYANIFIVILIAVSGDLLGDGLYYGIGYGSRRIIHSTFFQRLGMTEKRIEKLENLLDLHARKAVFLVKISPFIGPAGLVVIGSMHMELKKFFETATIISVPKSIILALIGFYVGDAYMHLGKAITDTQYAFFGLIAAIILVYVIYRKIGALMVKKIEE